MCKKVCKKIYKLIKKYDSIVIARHVGPDPDALGSQLALKETILTAFPNKKVYAVGHPASRFKYLGDLDGIDEEIMSKSLLFVLDTPNKCRVDGFIGTPAYSIKIDHHPYVEEFCDIEWIDDSSCSVAQMILELIFNTDLKLNSSIAIYNYFSDILGDKKQEYFYCVYLDTKGNYLDKKCLFVGTINKSMVHPREIFKEAYLLSANGIICVHNHPSGDATPSKEDIMITRQIKEIGVIHGINLIDHIIIGSNNYYSFYEDGDL